MDIAINRFNPRGRSPLQMLHAAVEGKNLSLSLSLISLDSNREIGNYRWPRFRMYYRARTLRRLIVRCAAFTCFHLTRNTCRGVPIHNREASPKSSRDR